MEAQQVGPGGAQRQPQRHLTGAGDRLCRREIADIHARDQQHHGGGRQQHQQRGPHRPVLPFACILHADGPIGVGARELLRELIVDGRQLVAGLLDRDAGGKLRQADDRKRRRARLRLGVEDHRREDLRVEERHGKPRRQHADDRVGLAVHDQRGAENGLGTERVAPVTIGDHCNELPRLALA